MRLHQIILAGCVLFSELGFAASFSMTTQAGRAFTMDVGTDRVTGETRDVTICGDRIESIKRVKLWMPEHGHGSTPTQVGPVTEGCRIISKVNFTMPGEWAVRVELVDGDTGAFLVDVEPN
jgi:hypothetical protein